MRDIFSFLFQFLKKICLILTVADVKDLVWIRRLKCFVQVADDSASDFKSVCPNDLSVVANSCKRRRSEYSQNRWVTFDYILLYRELHTGIC